MTLVPCSSSSSCIPRVLCQNHIHSMSNSITPIALALMRSTHTHAYMHVLCLLLCIQKKIPCSTYISWTLDLLFLPKRKNCTQIVSYNSCFYLCPFCTLTYARSSPSSSVHSASEPWLVNPSCIHPMLYPCLPCIHMCSLLHVATHIP